MRVQVAVVDPVVSVPVARPAVPAAVVLVVAALPALSQLPVVSLPRLVADAAVVAERPQVRLDAAVDAARRDVSRSGRSVKSLSSRQRQQSAVYRYLVATTRRSRSARAHPSLTSLRRSM